VTAGRPDPYNAGEHRFRFAAWCGATAARASKNCRFPVKAGVDLIRKVDGLRAIADSLDHLPDDGYFDDAHHGWCDRMLSVAKPGIGAGFTYGVAAKLVNCYLKAMVVGERFEAPDRETTRCDHVHPPVDRVLLSELEVVEKIAGNPRAENWKKLRKIGWSNFSEQDYRSAMLLIREKVTEDVGRPQLWQIERYWRGHQTV